MIVVVNSPSEVAVRVRTVVAQALGGELTSEDALRQVEPEDVEGLLRRPWRMLVRSENQAVQRLQFGIQAWKQLFELLAITGQILREALQVLLGAMLLLASLVPVVEQEGSGDAEEHHAQLQHQRAPVQGTGPRRRRHFTGSFSFGTAVHVRIRLRAEASKHIATARIFVVR